jgi:hypothetical protein
MCTLNMAKVYIAKNVCERANVENNLYFKESKNNFFSVSLQLGEGGENLFVLQQLISFFVSQKGSTVEVLTLVHPFENFQTKR